MEKDLVILMMHLAHLALSTDIIISVDEYSNPLSSKEVKVRVEGGTVGNDT